MSVQMFTNNLNVALRTFDAVTLNDTLPAAPDGATNITWQFDVFGNVSGYVSGGGGSTASGPVASIQTTDGDGNFTSVPNLLAEQLPSSTYCSLTLGGSNDNDLRQGFVASPSDPTFYFDTLSGGAYQFRYGGFTYNQFNVNGLAIPNTDQGISIGFGQTFSLNASLAINASSVVPILLTAGTLVDTPVNGAFEYDGTNLYFTVGGTRKTVTLV